MKKRKVLIIGSGVAGLVAGIYVRQAGMEVDLFEAHTVAGGNCTGWNRQGFYIDGCIQWLTGTRPGTGIHDLWRTCRALGDDVPVYHVEKIASTLHEGRMYHLYADLKCMERELLAISPEDAEAIRKLVKDIRRFQYLNAPIEKPFEQASLFTFLPLIWKVIRAGKPEKKTERMTIGDYLQEFRSPVIRQLLSCVFPVTMPLYTLFYSLGIRTSGDGDWPAGGSRAFVRRMQRHFEALGGRMHPGKTVDRIIVRNGQAVGIQLKDGARTLEADYVISAVDADMLLNHLLGGQYPDAFFEKRFAGLNRDYMMLSGTYVALGVAADLKDFPHNVYIRPEKPLRIHETELRFFNAKVYNFDPGLMREGKTVMTVLLTENEFDFWKALKARSPQAYYAEKRRIAEWVAGGIAAAFPELEGLIEMTDVATPLTFHHYCRSCRGSYMSFIPYGHVKKRIHRGTIDGVRHLYVAGQCTFPAGGLPLAAIAGKFAALRLLAADKKRNCR